MPLNYVPVRVVRLFSDVSPTFGLSAPIERELPGSPFLVRIYRVAQTTVTRDDDQPGTATLDEMQRLSVLDPACPIAVNDIAYLPQADGTTRRAKIMRPRPYSDRTQYDLETGAEGDALAPSALGPALPPAVSVQAQLDALQTELRSLQMAASLPPAAQSDPIVAFTATSTLTRPTQNTVREVKPTANAVATLYPATGSGIVEKFDISALGGLTFAVALASGDSYDANNAGVAAAIAQLIANGAASFALRDVAANTWHWE